MPLEILWDEMYPDDEHSCDGNEILKARFRRPQLIKPEDIVAVFNDVFKPLSLNEEAVFRPILEDGRENPHILLRDEKPLSTTKVWGFPIMFNGRKFNEDSALHVIHNVPLEERPLLGSCTWFTYAQPLTTLRLSLYFDWFSRKKNKEVFQAYQFTNELYWFFRDQVNNGFLAKKLVEKGYILTPQFDPSWTDFVMEDQCLTCGEIKSTMPWEKDQIKIGRISKNICHCRQRKGEKSSAIMRRFRIIGAYPIPPEEAEVARCEATVQADSAD